MPARALRRRIDAHEEIFVGYPMSETPNARKGISPHPTPSGCAATPSPLPLRLLKKSRQGNKPPRHKGTKGLKGEKSEKLFRFLVSLCLRGDFLNTLPLAGEGRGCRRRRRGRGEGPKLHHLPDSQLSGSGCRAPLKGGFGRFEPERLRSGEESPSGCAATTPARRSTVGLRV